MTSRMLVLAALLGLALLPACQRPQPFGEDLWRVVREVEAR